MKRIVLLLLAAFVCVSLSLKAQPQQPTTEQSKPVNGGAERLAAIINTSRSEWLGSFDKININGAMKVTLIHAAENEGPKIVFDTKGSTTTKFKSEVDKKGVLNVVETLDAKRTSVTEVTIYYCDMTSLSVDAADVTMEQSCKRDMFDLSVSGGAVVRAKFDVLDLAMEVTGRSVVVIEGASRYLDVRITTAKFDGLALQSVSAIVDASHGAEVSLSVAERLEASTSTSAKILYKGTPAIVRCHSSLFGGDIVSIDK